MAATCRHVGLEDQVAAIEALDAELKQAGYRKPTIAFVATPIVMPFYAGTPRNVPGSDYAESSGRSWAPIADYSGQSQGGPSVEILQKAAWHDLLQSQLREPFLAIMLEGNFSATGRRINRTNPREPFEFWSLVEEIDFAASSVRLSPDAGRESWWDVQIHPMALHPDETAPVQVVDKPAAVRDETPISAKSTIKTQTLCERWLKQQMAESPVTRPMPKHDYLTAAQAKFQGLSERAFERAWAHAVLETNSKWDRGGAPKKSPHQANPRTN